jgi:hypothetical protein
VFAAVVPCFVYFICVVEREQLKMRMNKSWARLPRGQFLVFRSLSVASQHGVRVREGCEEQPIVETCRSISHGVLRIMIRTGIFRAFIYLLLAVVLKA